MVFTAMPPFAMGLFDKVYSAEVMLKCPQLYAKQNSKLFNVKVFWVWIANALLHSVLLFWLPMLAYESEVIWGSGQTGGYLVLGNLVYTVSITSRITFSYLTNSCRQQYVVVTVCLKAGLTTNSWNWMTHCSIWGSMLLWFIFIPCYSNIWPTLPFAAVFAGMDKILYSSPVFWMGLFLIPITTLLVDMVFKL